MILICDGNMIVFDGLMDLKRCCLQRLEDLKFVFGVLFVREMKYYRDLNERCEVFERFNVMVVKYEWEMIDVCFKEEQLNNVKKSLIFCINDFEREFKKLRIFEKERDNSELFEKWRKR